jgi:ketosteroid isomerase-like protein
MSTEDEVRAASNKFYAALNKMANGDAGPMAEIWSHGDTVTTMHPIGDRQVGWDQVRGSWEQVAQIATDGEVRLDDQIIQVANDMAYELGIERGHLKIAGDEVHSIDDRVTNVYRREGGEWKIVHHHTDISKAMMDILKKLQAKA